MNKFKDKRIIDISDLALTDNKIIKFRGVEDIENINEEHLHNCKIISIADENIINVYVCYSDTMLDIVSDNIVLKFQELQSFYLDKCNINLNLTIRKLDKPDTERLRHKLKHAILKNISTDFNGIEVKI